MTGTRPAEILRQLEQSGEPDAELLRRFTATRDAGAFAELVRRHGPLVLGVCRRVTGHAQDAEDAFQATFLVLGKKAGSLRNAALLGNWLYGVAYRVSSRAKRAATRRRRREVTVSVLPEPPAPLVAPNMPELAPILDEELAALAECYREAIVLCDLRGVSREEAAAALGIPEGTLSSRLANGRKKLSARLTKRGVVLSVATLPVSLAEATAAVPNELVTKTCGLVADWAAGGAVPGPLAQLAGGGLPVRKTLMLVAVIALTVGGAVVAARSNDTPPVEPPKPLAVAQKPNPAPQPKAEPKSGDKQAVAYTDKPKMQMAMDIELGGISVAAWSPDGKFLAVQGNAPDVNQKSTSRLAVLAILPGKATSIGAWPADAVGNLVGFTSGSRELVTNRREYHLVSGFHWLRFYSLPDTIEKAIKERFTMPQRTVDLDLPETYGYAFAPDGKTFRTVALHRDATGTFKSLEVLEVDAATGRSTKSLLKTDHGQFALSANGKRLAVLGKEFEKVTVYDLDRGAKPREHTFGPVPPVELLSQPGFAPGFGQRDRSREVFLTIAPDGSRVAVSRGIGDTHIVDAETGKALSALEGAKEAHTFPDTNAFTGDGRLFAATGTRYRVATVKSGRSKEQTGLQAVGSFLTVWDTKTGKALKTWDKAPRVLFHPSKPLLAVLESSGENQTRVGFWDFAAEVEKK